MQRLGHVDLDQLVAEAPGAAGMSSRWSWMATSIRMKIHPHPPALRTICSHLTCHRCKGRGDPARTALEPYLNRPGRQSNAASMWRNGRSWLLGQRICTEATPPLIRSRRSDRHQWPSSRVRSGAADRHQCTDEASRVVHAGEGYIGPRIGHTHGTSPDARKPPQLWCRFVNIRTRGHDHERFGHRVGWQNLSTHHDPDICGTALEMLLRY